MRYLFSGFVFLTVGLLAMSAIADPADKDAKKGDGKDRAEMREKMLKEFDKDGDGKLSEEEREAARGKVRELRMAAAKKQGDEPAEKSARRGDRGKRDRGEAGRGERREVRRHEEGRSPEGRGPEARRGPGPGGPPPMLPKPEKLFAKFDKDKDEKLSKEEFKQLTEFVHEHMPHSPMAGRMGPPPEGRGFIERRSEERVFAQRGPDDGPRFRDGEGPRFRDSEGPGPGRHFRGPDGPPPRDGERVREFRRHDGPPPGDGPGARGEGPRGERRFIERDIRRGPPRERDDDEDEDRPAKHSKGDKDNDKNDKDNKADEAI
jgi:hypothetical protein